jgi:hypothetical protein
MKLTKGPLAGYKVEMAEGEKTRQYQEDVDKLVNLMGYEWALVTDLSRIGDFYTDETDVEMLSLKLGFPVTRKDYMWEVAMRTRKSN